MREIKKLDLKEGQREVLNFQNMEYYDWDDKDWEPKRSFDIDDFDGFVEISLANCKDSHKYRFYLGQWPGQQTFSLYRCQK